MGGLGEIKATVLLAAHHLSTAYWNYAVAWVTYAYNRKVLGQHQKKALPEFGQLILVRSKRDHKFQDKGELAIMMGFYSKIPNGIVALRVKEGQLRELCTAHCSPAYMEKDTIWYLKRDPNDREKRVYMSDKDEVSWDIPISSIPTVEEREIWDRHPKFISLQRSRDGWAWFASNIGRLLPPYQDIEVEDVEEPLPYLGNAGFYPWHEIKADNRANQEEEQTPEEIPFVPDHVLDMDMDPEIPPPSSKIRSRKLGGEIRLPDGIRDDILASDKMEIKMEPSELEVEIEKSQPGDQLAVSSSTGSVPQSGGGNPFPLRILLSLIIFPISKHGRLEWSLIRKMRAY